jgi:hypothetical protein
VVEVHERIRRPQLLLQLLASDDIPGALKQQHEDFEGLPLQPHTKTVLPQLARPEIQVEDAERDAAGFLLLHGGLNRTPGSYHTSP